MKILNLFFITTCFWLIGAYNSFAQNYFYANLKAPLLEYIAYNANQTNNDPNNTTAGLFFNAGYSVNFVENFYTEIGFDYLVRSTIRNKFYNTTNAINPIAQFEAENNAMALQIKPLYKLSIDADDNTFLTFGAGINYQKLFSKGKFTNFTNQQNPLEEIKTSKSNFHVVIQPEISIIFKTEKQIGYRLGISYSYINWDKASSNLHFSNNTNFVIPSYKSSNLFFSGGFVF